MDLKGKTAVVTGSGRGIGRAVALKLADLGVNVVLNATQGSRTVDEVEKGISARGVGCAVVRADVRNTAEAEKIIQTAVERFGRVDILVNNAGITRDNLIIRMSEQEWDDVLDTNLKGTFNCIKAVSRIMLKQKSGRIINITSVSGIVGAAGQANYSSSKAGVIGLTKACAKELASRGITVNALAPGLIDTDMTKVLSGEIKEEYMRNIPLKRLGTPEDVANAVAFLASDEAGYITGQIINIDGGMVM